MCDIKGKQRRKVSLCGATAQVRKRTSRNAGAGLCVGGNWRTKGQRALLISRGILALCVHCALLFH